jgi:hypothetical protein
MPSATLNGVAPVAAAQHLDRATVQDQTRRATRALVAAPSADRLDLVGVDLHPERKLIAKIIHSLRLLA